MGLPLVASYGMHVYGENPVKCPVFRWTLSLMARGVLLPDRCCQSTETASESFV